MSAIHPFSKWGNPKTGKIQVGGATWQAIWAFKVGLGLKETDDEEYSGSGLTLTEGRGRVLNSNQREMRKPCRKF